MLKEEIKEFKSIKPIKNCYANYSRCFPNPIFHIWHKSEENDEEISAKNDILKLSRVYSTTYDKVLASGLFGFDLSKYTRQDNESNLWGEEDEKVYFEGIFLTSKKPHGNTRIAIVQGSSIILLIECYLKDTKPIGSIRYLSSIDDWIEEIVDDECKDLIRC